MVEHTATLKHKSPVATLSFASNKVTKTNDIALVHEWLSTYAGSEKVSESIINILNNVQVFSTVDFLSTEERKNIIGSRKAKTTFIQNLPLARRHFRYYLPLFPLAIRTHNLKDYKVIVSSSHAFAHGVKTTNNQLHVSFCHTPMRYIWDMQELYLEANNMNSGLVSFASKIMAKILRKWDAHVSKNVDFYISNSHFTADRIKRCYGREAKVIYPPVEIEKFISTKDKEDFYVTASRFVCYKKVEVVVEAFTKMPDKKLIVIGDGNRKASIEKIATSNVTVLSHLEFNKFHEYMRKAKGFIFAGEEDFGITMVEAQACGTPVIAYNQGGAAEIVIDKETGLLFNQQTADSIKDAITSFEDNYNGQFPIDKIRKNAERFNQDRFNHEFLSFLNDCIREKFPNQV